VTNPYFPNVTRNTSMILGAGKISNTDYEETNLWRNVGHFKISTSLSTFTQIPF
jgi:hypothetical protein